MYTYSRNFMICESGFKVASIFPFCSCHRSQTLVRSLHLVGTSSSDSPFVFAAPFKAGLSQSVPCHRRAHIIEIRKERINMGLFVSCQILLVTIGLSLSSRTFKVSADSPVLREALEKYHRE